MDLNSVYSLFPGDRDCVALLERLRWKGGQPSCPYCKNARSTPLRVEQRHRCNLCNVSFSVTARTPFHRARVPLQKWFLAVALVIREGKGPSLRQLAAIVGVNKNTASHMVNRIRQASASEVDLFLALADEIMKE